MQADVSPSRQFDFSGNKDDKKLYAANPFPGLFSNDSIIKQDPKNGSSYSAFLGGTSSGKLPEVNIMHPPMSSG